MPMTLMRRLAISSGWSTATAEERQEAKIEAEKARLAEEKAYEESCGIMRDIHGDIQNPSILQLENKAYNNDFEKVQVTVKNLRDVIQNYEQDAGGPPNLVPTFIKNLRNLESKTHELHSDTPLDQEMLWDLVSVLDLELAFSSSSNSSCLDREYIDNAALRNAWFEFRRLMGPNLIFLLQCQNQAYEEVSKPEDKKIAFKILCETPSQVTTRVLRGLSENCLFHLSNSYLVIEACKHPEYTAKLFKEFLFTWNGGFDLAKAVTWLIAHDILTKKNKAAVGNIKISDSSMFEIDNTQPVMSREQAQAKLDSFIKNMKEQEEKNTATVNSRKKSPSVFFSTAQSYNAVAASVVPTATKEILSSGRSYKKLA